VRVHLRTYLVSVVALIALVYALELVLAVKNSGFGLGSEPAWGLDGARTEEKQAIAKLAAVDGATIDSRDGIDVVEQFHQRGVDAVTGMMLGAGPMGPDGFPLEPHDDGPTELMPLGGVALVKTVLCNESGQFVTFDSDEHGFRNPRGIWSSPQMDIAIVGESMVEGYCGGDGKTFVDLIRARYPLTLNLGISGQSSLLQLAAIKEYVASFRPRVVLWVFTEGVDLGDLQREAEYPLLLRYLTTPGPSQHLLTRQSEIDAVERKHLDRLGIRARQRRGLPETARLAPWFLSRLKLSALREELQASYGVAIGHAPTDLSDDRALLGLFRENLAQAQQVIRSWGGRLYFVYLPSWHRFRNGPRVAERERSTIFTLVSEVGVPIIDVSAAFKAEKDPLTLFAFRRFGHYDEKGHAVVADAVLPFLASDATQKTPAAERLPSDAH